MTVDHAAHDTTTEPDLQGFLLAHAGFRTEFGRLAGAARAVRDEAHAALIEDQIGLASDHLEHHHHDEDEWMWPLLRSRSPRTVAILDGLEEQHEHIDPLLHTVRDLGIPLADRADDMARLHDLLNVHLDQEERDAVPLIRRLILPAEFAVAAARMTATIPKKRVPVYFGWLASCGEPAHVAAVLSTLPWPVRVIFRQVWWPAYRRRFERLYGTALRRYSDR